MERTGKSGEVTSLADARRARAAQAAAVIVFVPAPAILTPVKDDFFPQRPYAGGAP